MLSAYLLTAAGDMERVDVKARRYLLENGILLESLHSVHTTLQVHFS